MKLSEVLRNPSPNLEILQKDEGLKYFHIDLLNRFSSITYFTDSNDLEETWSKFKGLMNDAVPETCSPVRRKTQSQISKALQKAANWRNSQSVFQVVNELSSKKWYPWTSVLLSSSYEKLTKHNDGLTR